MVMMKMIIHNSKQHHNKKKTFAGFSCRDSLKRLLLCIFHSAFACHDTKSHHKNQIKYISFEYGISSCLIDSTVFLSILPRKPNNGKPPVEKWEMSIYLFFCLVLFSQRKKKTTEKPICGKCFLLCVYFSIATKFIHVCFVVVAAALELRPTKQQKKLNIQFIDR